MQSCVKNKTVGGQLVQSAVQKNSQHWHSPLFWVLPPPSFRRTSLLENNTPRKCHPSKTDHISLEPKAASSATRLRSWEIPTGKSVSHFWLVFLALRTRALSGSATCASHSRTAAQVGGRCPSSWTAVAHSCARGLGSSCGHSRRRPRDAAARS